MLVEKPVLRSDMRVHIDEPNAHEVFLRYFSKMFLEMYHPSPLVILCIGTDRSTGDSLGPLVGERLKNMCKNVRVYGNLAEPVHAGNLCKKLSEINSVYVKPFIIAVDASLGRSENVGTVKLAPGSLRPGAGVNKDLPKVGNFYITGIVNIGGFMEYFVLQNTRLFTVIKMADIISYGISRGIADFFR